ncbi:MAG: type II toxin-antitoxin system RelB family antitoxin [Thiomonas sp.]
MNTSRSPIVSEFETPEQEARYTAWLQAKAQPSLDDPRPSAPHDEVMARIHAIISQAKEGRATDAGSAAPGLTPGATPPAPPSPHPSCPAPRS